MMRCLAWGSVELMSSDADHCNIVYSHIWSLILDWTEKMIFRDIFTRSDFLWFYETAGIFIQNRFVCDEIFIQNRTEASICWIVLTWVFWDVIYHDVWSMLMQLSFTLISIVVPTLGGSKYRFWLVKSNVFSSCAIQYSSSSFLLIACDVMMRRKGFYIGELLVILWFVF